jgi:hypothetical protein
MGLPPFPTVAVYVSGEEWRWKGWKMAVLSWVGWDAVMGCLVFGAVTQDTVDELGIWRSLCGLRAVVSMDT